MKKLTAALLTLIIGLASAACAAPASAPQPATPTATSTAIPSATVAPTSPTPTPADESEDLRVAVFYYSFADVLISTVREAMDEIFIANNIEFMNYDSNNSQTTQTEQVETAISLGFNFLVVNLVNSGRLDVSTMLVEMADEAGIPIVFFNRPMGENDEEGSLLAAFNDVVFVGTFAPEDGQMQGKMIGRFLVENFEAVDLNGDGVIQYAMLKGNLGNFEPFWRTRYAVEYANIELRAAGLPELVYFDPDNPNRFQVDPRGAWSAEAAFEIMRANFATFNEANGNMIELVIANNDGMADGAVSALQDIGWNLGGQERKIPVFGIDGTDSGIELIRLGMMTGTVKQNNVGMAEGIWHFIDNVNSGRDFLHGLDTFATHPEIPKKIFIPFAPFTG